MGGIVKSVGKAVGSIFGGGSSSPTTVTAPSAVSQGIQYTPEQIERISQPYGLMAPTGGITWDYDAKTGTADISQMYREIADPLFARAKALGQVAGAFDPMYAAQQYYQQYVEPDLSLAQQKERLALENRLISQGMFGSTGGSLQVGELIKAQEASKRQARAEAIGQSQSYYDALRQQQLQDIAAAASIYESPQTLFQTGAGVGANIGGVMASYRPVYASQTSLQGSSGGGLLGGLAGGLGGTFGQMAGGWLGSKIF